MHIKKLSNKLTDNNGASMVLALGYLLLVTMVASVIVMGATINAETTQNKATEIQSSYNVSNAAQALASLSPTDLDSGKEYGETTYEYYYRYWPFIFSSWNGPVSDSDGSIYANYGPYDQNSPIYAWYGRYLVEIKAIAHTNEINFGSLMEEKLYTAYKVLNGDTKDGYTVSNDEDEICTNVFDVKFNDSAINSALDTSGGNEFNLQNLQCTLRMNGSDNYSAIVEVAPYATDGSVDTNQSVYIYYTSDIESSDVGDTVPSWLVTQFSQDGDVE